MHARNFSLVIGIVFLLVGIAGFIPSFVTPLQMHQRIVAGIFGVMGFKTYLSSRRYARGLFY